MVSDFVLLLPRVVERISFMFLQDLLRMSWLLYLKILERSSTHGLIPCKAQPFEYVRGCFQIFDIQATPKVKFITLTGVCIVHLACGS